MIDFKNLEIRYDDFIAIRDLNLTVEKGEFFTFLGPSGCGKTTTLRSLVGFITPSKGQILIEGKEINNVPIEKRGIGIVFQSYALFPSMTVYENLAFGLNVQKINKDEVDKRVKEVARKVSLKDEQLHRNVSELSGGQQQRVALARAVILEPKILCLDEPLSNLDAKLRVGLRGELKRLQKELGITTLYVTHDQEEALTMSDKIAIFNNGCIEQVGTPYEIYNKSKTEFVCDFIGDINKVQFNTIAEINKQACTHFDSNKLAFIRLERVKTSDTLPYDVCLTGKVTNFEYNGVITRYSVEIFGEKIRCFKINNGGKYFDIGDEITLYISSEDIMQY